jgi:hypothetical protein
VSTITIPARFRGPVESGNGGYTCGLIARHVAPEPEITLRAPPPLDTPLAVAPRPEGGVVVRDGGTVIAEGRSVAPWTHEIPAAPTPDEAEHAATRYAGFVRHAFPECFVCGHHREPGDGLRILAGPVEGRDLVASPWAPSGGFPADEGVLTTAMVWAALDCPGAWAVERAARDRPVVLGRMAAILFETVPDRGDYVAFGWPIGVDGRKLFSGTGLADQEGRIMATARQTWIVLA